MQCGTIFNVQRFSVRDGPGLRTTVFFKGCPLNCLWCHNPEGMNGNSDLAFRKERCLVCGLCKGACPSMPQDSFPLLPGGAGCSVCGSCTQNCPTEARVLFGRVVSSEELMASILRDRIFFDQSGGGVTFSGGEPTFQPVFLEKILTECCKEGISTAIDTCGYADKAVLLGLAQKADLVLFDVKGFDSARHCSNTGVDATSILENLDALVQAHHSIWLRVPVVPGYTDDAGEMESLASRYALSESIKRVALLPYHPLGAAKLDMLGNARKMPDIATPSQSTLETLAGVWRRRGFDVHIGGMP